MKQFHSVALLALVLFAANAFSQPFPGKPVRFIIPFPPGGGTTMVAHLIGPKLSEIWGQPVVVENRPGGNTVIGHEALLRLPPDGHTIVMSTSAFVLNSLFLNLSCDSLRDFAPVMTLYNSEQVLSILPALPASNLKELVALAKSRPGELIYATVSSGGTNHLAARIKADAVTYARVIKAADIKFE